MSDNLSCRQCGRVRGLVAGLCDDCTIKTHGTITPWVAPRESDFTLDELIDKLTTVPNPDRSNRVHKGTDEAILCLALEIKKLKAERGNESQI